MQQPPPDRSNKNPYAMPTAWPRPPETTFHLRVPKAPPGTQAPKPAAPRPPRPGSSILTGSALPVGYTAPQPRPEIEAVQVEAPVAPSVAEPAREPEAVAEPAPDVAPAPPFIAPRQPTFAAPRKARRRENRAPLIAGAVVTALVGIGAAAWLLLREPEPAALETTTIPPAVHEPVIVPPSFEGLMTESEADAAELRGPAEPAQATPARRAVTRTAQAQAPAAVELPSRPVPYSGDATPALNVPTPPAIVLPSPVAPPPASAPGPRTPIADPDAPQTTRDPTSGD